MNRSMHHADECHNFYMSTHKPQPYLPQHAKSDAALTAVNKPDKQFAAWGGDAVTKTLSIQRRYSVNIDFQVLFELVGCSNQHVLWPEHRSMPEMAMTP